MTPFTYGFLGEGAVETHAIQFKDGTFILPDWVTAITRYNEMDDIEQERFRRGCKKVAYPVFLENCRTLASSHQFQRETLNEIQSTVIKKHFARLKAAAQSLISGGRR